MKNLNILYNKILFETKQQFHINLYKQNLINLFNKMINDQEDKFDYEYDIKSIIYKILRYKPFNIPNTIDNQTLSNFTNSITKNIQSFDDLTSNWAIYKYNENNNIIHKQTFNKYITPNLNYSKSDLLKLQSALINLKEFTNNLAIKNNTFLALKFNISFEQYFNQNDNIKLYCTNQNDINLLDIIEKHFLSTLNTTNERIYKNRS